MIRILCFIAIIFCSCSDTGDAKVDKRSQDQRALHLQIGKMRQCYYGAPNDARKKDCVTEHTELIHKYIGDSLINVFKDFRVKIRLVSSMPWDGKYALIFRCEDELVEYWFEEHFKTQDEMKKSGWYKMISNYREGRDTAITFMYRDKLFIDQFDMGFQETDIRVVPFPDSIAAKIK